MSHHQSRAERSESTHYRKTGRSGSFNQQRQFPGSVSGMGGGAPTAQTNASNRSFKMYDSNTAGGLLRPRSPNVSTGSSNSSRAHAHQNGPPQQQTYRISNAPVISSTSNIRPTNATPQQINQAVPRAPSSNISVAVSPSTIPADSSDSKVPTTPAKSSGDASRSFPLQFGSISPGLMDKMQIPARTSSAPPNLDEQKKDQARHDFIKNAPAVPPPSIPKQHLTKKDIDILDQSNAAGEAHPLSNSKRDTQVCAARPVIETQKPSLLPVHTPVHLPFHQPQVSAQFGSHNPPIQSQPKSGTSLQLPMSMPLPMGNLPVQQPMFVSGLQAHPMHSQGIIHQGQAMNFSQMGPQLPPHLGNIGMSIVPQFPQQQAGQYNVSRKTVKITHPETHEELRLDSSPGPKSHSNMLPQSQLIPSFPPNHPMNFYSDPYRSPSLVFSTASSSPLNSAQGPSGSQPPVIYAQVAMKPNVSSQGDKEIFQHASSLSAGKVESLKSSKLYMDDSSRQQTEIKPPSLPELKPGSGISFASSSSSCPVNVESNVLNTPSFVLAASNGLTLMSTSLAEEPTVGVLVSNSIKDKSDTRGIQNQVSRQLTSISKFSSQIPETGSITAETASSEVSYPLKEGTAEGKTSDRPKSMDTKNVTSCQLKPDTMGTKEQREVKTCECLEPDLNRLDTSMKSLSLESSKLEENLVQTIAFSADSLLEHAQQKTESSRLNDPGDTNVPDSFRLAVCGDIKKSVIMNSEIAQDVKTSISDVLLSVPVNVRTSKSVLEEQDAASVLVPSPKGALRCGSEDDDVDCGLISVSEIGKDNILSDATVSKSVVPRGKKKKKDLFRKAEAAGTSSDMYMAYKCPEEKTKIATSAEGAENISSIGMKHTSVDVPQDNALSTKKPSQSEAEPDDWEDAAEIPSPQLETLKNENESYDGNYNELIPKRYSLDFLFKFQQKCTDLPDGFDINSDIGDVLLVSSVFVSHESHPSPGRNIDRPIGGSRLDRRGSGLGDDDKWNKHFGIPVSGRGDMRADIGHAGNTGFRNGQGGNPSVLRNPRGQTPGQYSGGIFSGPVQSLGSQGGLQRNNSDSDRWQRGTGFQKGSLTPLQLMHKTEKRYEVGKVSDEEEAKQRQLKSILNKLTPQNFEKLFEQVKQVGIDNVVTLTGVISQIFDKALMEPTFCEMYAMFCFHLAKDLPNLIVEKEKITFRRLLLNKCQQEFERGEREEADANNIEKKGESEHTTVEREEKKLQAKRRMLGNIRLIGELYKKKMLTEKIMHECINQLLGEYQTPDEENIEALCKLMSTIGEMIDHSRAKEFMDAYFDIMYQMSSNINLSSRVRFMLKDVIDLRKNKWQQRRKVEGPKMIDEVHRDAAQERHAQSSRLSRAPSIGGSVRRSPLDFSPRTPSMLPSPNSQIGSFHNAPPQVRSYGSQNGRTEERHSIENRNMSITLPQKPHGDESITLLPQGGLAKGMTFKGQPSAPMPSPGVVRRMGPSLNGFSSMPDQTAYGRSAAPSMSHLLEPEVINGNREVGNVGHGFDGSLRDTSSAHGRPLVSVPDVSCETLWSEELLRNKSIAAIKEYYSARDENEVVLCIKDLNTPSFYPSMISIWVTDSFERKDTERDILTKLLISLVKRQDDVINNYQLTEGFESVLCFLEDAVNDAPRAAEFLGRILAQVTLENIISLSEIGRLIYEGGEEPGRLVQVGLAARVLGSILEIIKSEKGESVLNELLRSSPILQLEKFRPPVSKGSLTIDKFI